MFFVVVFLFKQKTAYEMRISDWSSDVCSSDLIAELLAKALSQGSLDQALTAADKEKLLPFLKAYGDLGADYRFTGTERSGFSTSPGAGVTFASPSKIGRASCRERVCQYV